MRHCDNTTLCQKSEGETVGDEVAYTATPKLSTLAILGLSYLIILLKHSALISS